MGNSKKSSSFYKKLFTIHYTLITAFLFFSLIAIHYALSTTEGQEQTITLDISVTNPLDEGVHEVELRAGLPKELTKEDVISSDGLELGFDVKEESLFVKGKVTLQPAETTIYKIIVEDVWVIPESEISALRSALGTLRFAQEAQDAIARADKILARQRESRAADIRDYIMGFRENQKEFNDIKQEIRALTERAKAQSALNRRFTLIGILLALFGVAIFIGLRKRQYLVYLKSKLRELRLQNRRAYARLFNPKDVQCKLLIEQEGSVPAEEINPFIVPEDISEGGICLTLAKAYGAQSVVEVKIKLPSYEQLLIFRGSIIWQKKSVGYDQKEHYLTGVKLGEATEEDFRRLREFVNERLPKRGWLRWISR